MGNIIDAKDLTDEQVAAIERLVTLFRKRRPKKERNGFRRSAGAWKGLIDAEQLKREIYADRLVSTRPEIKL